MAIIDSLSVHSDTVAAVNHSEVLLDSIFKHTTTVAVNTGWDFWSDGLGFLAVLALTTSILTAVPQWLTTRNTNKLSRDNQKRLLYDLVRHLYRNLVIVCTISYKMEKTKQNDNYTNYPSEEHLYKLKIALEKLQLNLFFRDSEYEQVEELYLNFRNYNTEIDVICEHLKNPQIDYDTKQRDISTLVFKSAYLTEKIVKLLKIIFSGEKDEIDEKARKQVRGSFESGKNNTLEGSYGKLDEKVVDELLKPMLKSYDFLFQNDDNFIKGLRKDIEIETGKNLSGGEKVHLINLPKA